MRETAFLFQRSSITIQRFNAVAFRGTITGQDTDEQYCDSYPSQHWNWAPVIAQMGV